MLGRRSVFSSLPVAVLASVLGCEPLPNEDNACHASGVRYQAPVTSCEGSTLVTTRSPCIDGHNRDHPPATEVSRQDCTQIGTVCTNTTFDPAAFACRRICGVDTDCTDTEYCGEFTTPSGNLLCSPLDHFKRGKPCQSGECGRGLTCRPSRAVANDAGALEVLDGAADAVADGDPCGFENGSCTCVRD